MEKPFDFGIHLAELRKNRNITQFQLANITGISRSSISKYEMNTQEPSLTNIIKLSSFFNVSCDYLIGYQNSKNLVNIDGLSKKEKETLIFLLETFRGKKN